MKKGMIPIRVDPCSCCPSSLNKEKTSVCSMIHSDRHEMKYIYMNDQKSLRERKQHENWKMDLWMFYNENILVGLGLSI
jgi:hypothetical protein